MTFKKWMSLMMIVAMLLTGLTGCGSKSSAEEGAAVGEYVEGEAVNGEQSLPETVGDPTVIQDSYVAPETPDKTDKNQETPKSDSSETQSQPQETPGESSGTETDNLETQTPSGNKTTVAVDPTSPDWSTSNGGTTGGTGSNDEGSQQGSEQEEVTVTTDPNLLKIVSYNIRSSNDANGNTFAERAPRLQALMAELDPDIMGFQEVVTSWMPYLDEYFNNEYESLNKWRAESNKEGTPVYWKRDKFTLMKSGYFWLSETPDVESKAIEWGAECYRICIWVRLKVKSTGKEFLYFNTHFDHKGNKSCYTNSAKLITERVQAQGGFTQYPVFCTGDFNMTSSNAGYTEMCKTFQDINRSLSNDKTPTYTNYGTIKGSIIDYCFYSADLIQPQKYQVLNPKTNGGYPSDHSCVYVEAKLL